MPKLNYFDLLQAYDLLNILVEQQAVQHVVDLL